ncbi:MAG: hypothetical protein ABR543_05545 [Gemmatimonadaceae bacterium]
MIPVHSGQTSMYIDPGAGSLILQIVAATLISAAAMMKQVRQTAKNFFRTVFSRSRTK